MELPLKEPVGVDNELYTGDDYMEWATSREVIMQVCKPSAINPVSYVISYCSITKRLIVASTFRKTTRRCFPITVAGTRAG